MIEQLGNLVKKTRYGTEIYLKTFSNNKILTYVRNNNIQREITVTEYHKPFNDKQNTNRRLQVRIFKDNKGKEINRTILSENSYSKQYYSTNEVLCRKTKCEYEGTDINNLGDVIMRREKFYNTNDPDKFTKRIYELPNMKIFSLTTADKDSNTKQVTKRFDFFQPYEWHYYCTNFYDLTTGRCISSNINY